MTQSGNTGSVEYAVDPSVYDSEYESEDPDLTKGIRTKLGENSANIKLLSLKFKNYYTIEEVDGLILDTQEFTYDRDTIDNKDAAVLQEAKEYTYSKQVIDDTTAKLAVSNVFTQPQQVPNATLPQHTTNLSQVETMFEMFKQQLRGYNLGGPDLTGAEDLGDGEYRLYNNNDITIDYNVYNGEYNVNGSPSSTFAFDLIDILPDTEYTVSYIGISGVLSGGGFRVYITSPYTTVILQQTNENINKQNTFTTTTQNLLRFEFVSGRIFNDYKFKLQLEKGDTATPYTLPGQIPQYKIVGEE